MQDSTAPGVPVPGLMIRPKAWFGRTRATPAASATTRLGWAAQTAPAAPPLGSVMKSRTAGPLTTSSLVAVSTPSVAVSVYVPPLSTWQAANVARPSLPGTTFVLAHNRLPVASPVRASVSTTSAAVVVAVSSLRTSTTTAGSRGVAGSAVVGALTNASDVTGSAAAAVAVAPGAVVRPSVQASPKAVSNPTAVRGPRRRERRASCMSSDPL